MKASRILITAVALCANCIAPARAGADDFPFIAIRSMGSGATNPKFTETIFAANEKYPGLVDEIWFGGCSPYVTGSLDEALRCKRENKAETIVFGLTGTPIKITIRQKGDKEE